MAPITAVAFVKPKAGTFTADITHVMVIATTQMINVVAVAVKSEQNKVLTWQFYNTGICTAASGAPITSIIGTKNGRVFGRSEDGRVWEIDYRVRQRNGLSLIFTLLCVYIFTFYFREKKAGSPVDAPRRCVRPRPVSSPWPKSLRCAMVNQEYVVKFPNAHMKVRRVHRHRIGPYWHHHVPTLPGFVDPGKSIRRR